MLRMIRASLALVLASVPAFATTWIVDASGGPGSQFTDIGAAIAASAPGDVILVRAGTYPSFVAATGVTILGQGGVTVNGQAAFVGVSAVQRAALVNVTAQRVIVDSCDGPVIVQDVQATDQVRCISSADVRCRSVSAIAPAGPLRDAFTVESSRVEMHGCTSTGSSGSGPAQSGGSGIHAFSSGRLFVVASTARGGAGTNSIVDQTYAGNGGHAIRIENGSFLRIAGGLAQGGLPGWCEGPIGTAECCYDGQEGHAIFSLGSSCSYSFSTSLISSGHFSCPHCFWVSSGVFAGDPFSQFTQVVPDDPELSTSGTPTPGQSITFTVKGPPGAPATLWLGRGLIVQPTPPVAIELLVPRARVFLLGPIPPTGTISRTFAIPAGIPVGFGFAAQAEVVLPAGEVRRTNSTPIVVR